MPKAQTRKAKPRGVPPIEDQIRRDDLARVTRARRLEKRIQAESRALRRDMRRTDLALDALGVTIRQRKPAEPGAANGDT